MQRLCIKNVDHIEPNVIKKYIKYQTAKLQRGQDVRIARTQRKRIGVMCVKEKNI